MTKAEDWGETLDDLERRRRHAWAMGGPERLDKHRGKGKLDARARIERLVDPGTFRELGTLVGGDVAADGLVVGSGEVNGSPVMLGAEDFTTMAGSIGPGGNSKRYRIAELALRDKIPLVMMLEGAGFRPTGGHYGRSPTDLLAQTQCSGRVPTVAAVLGPSAGHGALVAPVCDFRIMSAQGAIFTAGPPVVKESTGEDISKEDLGGPDVALASGVIHNVAQDDETVIDEIRRYLSYFPSSAWSYPPSLPASESSAPRPTPELFDIVSRDNRRVYDMRDVLDVVFDGPDWFEVQPQFGRAIICALAHLGGHPVAVVANQPKVIAGSIDAEAADKAAHFITVADSFHLPIVFLADNPGMLPGSRSERSGVLRAGARMFAAQTAATTLKLHLTLHKAYGFGSMVMSLLGFDHQVATFAYPGATMGAMSAAALSRASNAGEDLSAKLRNAELQASYRSAAATGILSVPLQPDIPGMTSFAGASLFTSRWPKDGFDLAGKRVGVIGTGSTGVQLIPVVAREALQLFVFQRSPAYTLPWRVRRFEPGELEELKARYPEIRAAQRAHPVGAARLSAFSVLLEMLHRPPLKSATRAEQLRAIEDEGVLGALNWGDLFFDIEANRMAAKLYGEAVARIVKDPDTAAALVPDHPFACKRPIIDDGYYETFNRDNVTLVDLRRGPIREVTPAGIRTEHRAYDLDVIVYATGFDAMTGALSRIDIRGRGGMSLAEFWAGQGPLSYLGLAVAGFPNLFTIQGPGSPSAATNFVAALEQHVEWIGDCLVYLRANGISTIEALAGAQQEWMDHAAALVAPTVLVHPSCNSWYNGGNVPGKKRMYMGYTGGIPEYRRRCDEIAAGGYTGFKLG